MPGADSTLPEVCLLPCQYWRLLMLVAEEEVVLQYWKDIDAFQESMRQSKDRKPFVFLDGPPFCSGCPSLG
jgi:isoleucyl-tRNA synthetase